MTIRYVRLWLGQHESNPAWNRPDFAGHLVEGYHCLLLFDAGHKLCSALHPGTVQHRRVPLASYATAQDVPLSPRHWRKMAKRIERRARCLAGGRKALRRRRETGVAATIRQAVELCRQEAGDR